MGDLYSVSGNTVFTLPADPINQSSWRKVSQCKTADRPEQTAFKESVLEICRRGDEEARVVMVSVFGAATDLHAADAQHHSCCYKSFSSERNIQAAA